MNGSFERERFTISMNCKLKNNIYNIALIEGRSMAKQIEKICEEYINEYDNRSDRKRSK
ncbi:MAG: hypothetical protein ACRCX8_01465 [Sarcina sp.]